MTDWHRLIDRLDPPADGETPIRHRTGVVAAINTDGTIDVEISGIVISGVSVLAGATVTVGDTVQALSWRGDLFVLGGVATDEGQTAVGTYTPVLTAVTTNPTRQLSGSIEGTYLFTGRVVSVWVRIVYGPTGIAGSGALICSLPLSADVGGGVVASTTTRSGSVLGGFQNRDDDTLASSTTGVVQLSTASTVRFGVAPTGAFLAGGGSIAAPGDTLLFNAVYPVDL